MDWTDWADRFEAEMQDPRYPLSSGTAVLLIVAATAAILTSPVLLLPLAGASLLGGGAVLALRGTIPADEVIHRQVEWLENHSYDYDEMLLMGFEDRDPLVSGWTMKDTEVFGDRQRAINARRNFVLDTITTEKFEAELDAARQPKPVVEPDQRAMRKRYKEQMHETFGTDDGNVQAEFNEIKDWVNRHTGQEGYRVSDRAIHACETDHIGHVYTVGSRYCLRCLQPHTPITATFIKEDSTLPIEVVE